MSRKNARESVYTLVFEFLFNNEQNNLTLDMIMLDTGLTSDDRDYIKDVYTGVINEYDELIAIIQKYAIKYTTTRMVKSDIAALLVAIYEMKHVPSVPHSVAINEAVEIVKKYSTDKSGAYVNGILSSVYKELNDTGKIKE